MTRYFGFALSSSMFSGDRLIRRREITLVEAKGLIDDGIVSCLNKSHEATIDAMRFKFGIDVAIPEVAPRVSLGVGDELLVMGVVNLPRLMGDRKEYTDAEIVGATFEFVLYSVEE